MVIESNIKQKEQESTLLKLRFIIFFFFHLKIKL